MSYNLGDEDLDARLHELVRDAVAGDPEDDTDDRLVAEILVSGLKMLRDNNDRGNLKLTNSALKEMRYAFLIFSKYQHIPKVTMYGSARTPEDAPNYKLAAEFARIMAEDEGWMVVTGAGPGIMRAGNQGAGIEKSFGVAIRLPFEASNNEFLHESRLINFKYFFTRKLMFVKESDAFVMFPGGFGTQDEAFELLTLVQTGKAPLAPIVLLDAPGTGYWDAWRNFVDVLLEQGMIAHDDLHLYLHTNDPGDARDEILRFYSNYHSQRYVEGKLVIRMKKGPTAEQLAELNVDFASIVVSGAIESAAISAHEARDGDAPDLDRIKFHFNRRDIGKLRQMVNRINGWVSGS
ncbi:MAG: TIGR00730 family Rossman fold protein [Acidimicrobiia bacterium]|nr:TIGR00730 family Rossman fold protein [Acidimicrobiia bacterium]